MTKAVEKWQMHVVTSVTVKKINMSSRFSYDTEAFASESQENLE